MNLQSIFAGQEKIDSVINKGKQILSNAGIFGSTDEQNQSVAILDIANKQLKKTETMFGETVPRIVTETARLRDELRTRLKPKVDSLFTGLGKIEKALFAPGTEILKPFLEKSAENIPESRTVTSGLFGEIPVKQSLLSTVPALALAADLFGPGGKEKAVKEIKEFKGFKDLTTKFLEYAKGKTTLSRQEIMDFARRPELKKGEADLLMKKLEEFVNSKLPDEVKTQLNFSDNVVKELEKYNVPLGKEGQIKLYAGMDKIDLNNVRQEGLRAFTHLTTDKGVAGKFGKTILEIEARPQDLIFKGDTVAVGGAKGLTFQTPSKMVSGGKGIWEISAKDFNQSQLTNQAQGTSKLPAQEFADSIRRDLLELKPVKMKDPPMFGERKEEEKMFK